MKIAPSILAADMNNLENEIKSINKAHYLHLDVMDGKFVENTTFDYELIREIRTYSSQVLDTHLMIENPLEKIKKYAESGSDYITFHVEVGQVKETINKIKKLGKYAGISIKPNTDIETLLPYLSFVDLVLVMSVEPGMGGQKFMPSAIDKVKFLFEYRKIHNYKYLISIDGGINDGTIGFVKEYIDIAVMGTNVFKKEDRNQYIKNMDE